MPAIVVEHLSKTYVTYKRPPGVLGALKSLIKRERQYVEAVRDISFTIEEGELVGFLGPNGAGKTTTLKMLSGIIFPTAGTAQVLGYIPWERRPEMQRQIALVMGQKMQLWWGPARIRVVPAAQVALRSARQSVRAAGERAGRDAGNPPCAACAGAAALAG
jgi:ABC-type uncharacterized transport system ATPase subunit